MGKFDVNLLPEKRRLTRRGKKEGDWPEKEYQGCLPMMSFTRGFVPNLQPWKRLKRRKKTEGRKRKISWPSLRNGQKRKKTQQRAAGEVGESS